MLILGDFQDAYLTVMSLAHQHRSKQHITVLLSDSHMDLTLLSVSWIITTKADPRRFCRHAFNGKQGRRWEIGRRYRQEKEGEWKPWCCFVLYWEMLLPISQKPFPLSLLPPSVTWTSLYGAGILTVHSIFKMIFLSVYHSNIPNPNYCVLIWK